MKIEEAKEITYDLIDTFLEAGEISLNLREKGLIRPLIVSHINGKYMLKLGILRFLAFKKLNHSNIFCPGDFI